MPKILPQAIKDKVVAMRCAGAVFSEIIQETKLSNGTISLLLSKITLPAEAEEIIKKKISESSKKNAIVLAERNRARRKPESPKREPKYTPEERLQQSLDRLAKAKVKYKEHELPVKKLLEDKYKCEFKKELVDDFVINFASDQHLILVSYVQRMDYHMVKQFAVCRSVEDKRKMIAYLQETEKVAARRMRKLRVKVMSAVDLLGGEVLSKRRADKKALTEIESSTMVE